MKRLLLVLLSLLAIVGLLWQTVAPVRACTCSRSDDDDDSAARSFLRNDLVVLVSIADTNTDYTQVTVQRIYKGDAPAILTLDQTRQEVEWNRQSYPGGLATGPGDCSVVLLGEPGERYLLALRHSTELEGAYSAGLCSMSAMRYVDDESSGVGSFFRAIEKVSNGGFAPGGVPPGGVVPAADASFPWLLASAIAVIGPVAFLAGAAFVWRRGV